LTTSETRTVEQELRNWFATVGPAGTAVAVGPVMSFLPFDNYEASAVVGFVDKRRHEFLTGRALARRALAELGCDPTGIPAGEDRSPIWPNDYLGSISHTDALCLAHVGRCNDLLGIGVDLERRNALSPELRDYVAECDEWDRLNSGVCAPLDIGTLCFSAKEAFFKAYFPVTKAFLDFSDVRLDLDWTRHEFLASLVGNHKPSLYGQRQFTGRFALTAVYVVTAVWIAH